MKNKKQSITIIGAGLAGCFMAILLAKRGYRVNLYERSSADEHKKQTSKRSFALTFYSRGVQALQKAGLWEKVKKILISLDGAVVHMLSTAPKFVPQEKGKAYYAVSRIALLEKLLQEVQHFSSITLHFSTELIFINRQEKKIIFRNRKTKKISSVPYDVLFGADGVNSRVRTFLQEGQETKHIQTYESWSYKEISIPANILTAQKNAMHVYPREHALLVAFPNHDDSLSAMLLVPENGFSSLRSPAKIKTFITNNFQELLPALSQITRNILTYPESTLVSIETTPWYYKESIVILGDAAHGSLPFYGQGIPVVFEDCLELAELIDTQEADWGKIFPLYQQKRKIHADTLVTLSKKNFDRFLRYKGIDYTAVFDTIDLFLHKLFPNFWHPPLYTMIANSTEPFADIWEKHTKQRRIARMTGISVIALLIVLIHNVVATFMAQFFVRKQETVS